MNISSSTSDTVNINNMSEKLREVLERKPVIDHIPQVKEEKKIESELISPKLEPVTPDLLGNDVFNEVEITSEVEVSTSEDISKPDVKEEPMEVNEAVYDNQSMDSISTADQEISNEDPNIIQDTSSCDAGPGVKVPDNNLLQDSSRCSDFTVFNDSNSNLDKQFISSVLSDDNSQSSVSKHNSDDICEEVDIMTSDKCGESVCDKSQRIVKSEGANEKVVVTTTTTTTTTSTQQVTTVDGVIKSFRTTESVSSEHSKTIM